MVCFKPAICSFFFGFLYWNGWLDLWLVTQPFEFDWAFCPAKCGCHLSNVAGNMFPARNFHRQLLWIWMVFLNNFHNFFVISNSKYPHKPKTSGLFFFHVCMGAPLTLTCFIKADSALYVIVLESQTKGRKYLSTSSTFSQGHNIAFPFKEELNTTTAGSCKSWCYTSD